MGLLCQTTRSFPGKAALSSASVGSTESLVMPPSLLGAADLTPAERAASLIGKGTVRLSVGLEDPEDLIGDLEQALAAGFV